MKQNEELGGNYPILENRNYTLPVATGIWSADCNIGRRYGKTLCQRIVAAHEPDEFVQVVKSMITKGEITGVEVGFIQEIAEGLL